MSHKSASGYGGLGATPLARQGYYDEIIAMAWERDFLPEITNSEIDERIVSCNQIVQFTRQPSVGPWRTYEKNQELIADQLTPEAFTLEICNAKYKDIKIDKKDIKDACNNWAKWEASFLESTYQGLTEEWRTYVLNAMILETSGRHKNNRAGKFRNVSLGQPGDPSKVSPRSIAQHFARLKKVIRDANRWEEGKMFVVVPTEISEVLAGSNVADAAVMGNGVGTSMIIDGLYPNTLFGFKVIESTHAPTVVDQTGVVAHYIIAGHQDAFAFAADIIEGRIVEPSRTFGVEYQMLAVWGGKMIFDDAMAVGYWTFVE